MYKDKSKQKDAVKAATKRYRHRKQGITSEGITRTIVDACGNTHQIDFEGRRELHSKIVSWARNEGTEYQRRLGLLSLQYTVIKDIDLAHYLGYDKLPASIKSAMAEMKACAELAKAKRIA